MDVEQSEDVRDLGVCLKGLSILRSFNVDEKVEPDTAIALDNPLFCYGFHAFEDGVRRWASGRAKLPCAFWQDDPDGIFIRVDMVGPVLPRWVAPAAAANDASEPFALTA